MLLRLLIDFVASSVN